MLKEYYILKDEFIKIFLFKKKINNENLKINP